MICNFAFCTLNFAFIYGCAKQEIKNIDAKGKNIICFGDSITFGYGAEPGQDYPSGLAKLVNFPVINAGIDGDTSIEAIRRIKSDILDKEPLLVIIEFGGNDFLRKIPLPETIKNIEQMVQEIQSSGAMVAIADISTSIIMGDYGRELKGLSRKYKTIFIPHILSGILNDPKLKSDFIHPNAQGYMMIARKVQRVILPYLNRNGLAIESPRQK